MLYKILRRLDKELFRISPKLSFLLEHIFYLKYINKSNIFLVSYPKCGRTWVHLLLTKYFSSKYDLPMKNKLAKMAEKESKIPKLMVTHDGKEVNFITKSKKLYKNKSIIFLVRDPRDVIISHYYHHKKRDNTYKKEISNFIRHKTLGIKTIITFMNAWLKNKEIPKEFMVIRYEDLRNDTKKEAIKLLTFLGEKNIDFPKLEEAIEFTNFEKMQKLEQSKKIPFFGLKEKPNEDKNTLKERKGKVGGYKEELNDTDISYADSSIKNLDPSFGYF